MMRKNNFDLLTDRSGQIINKCALNMVIIIEEINDKVVSAIIDRQFAISRIEQFCFCWNYTSDTRAYASLTRLSAHQRAH